jgi:hypothetical protein
MVTRAVHLVVVQDQSTEAFLNGLRTFASVRGWPKSLYSNNRGNFISVEKELQPVLEALTSTKEFQGEMLQRGVTWRRYPPLAPHWGGLHKSLVCSAKRALYHAVGIGNTRSHLKDLVLVALYAEVTSFLNGRPLMPVSDDPADGYLMPNHFLLPSRLEPSMGAPPNITSVSPY